MSDVLSALPRLWDGILITSALTLTSALGGAVLSLLAGLGRLSRRRLIRWPSAVYIEVFRGFSALALLFWLFFVLPFYGISLSPFVAGVVGLSMTVGAYGAEIVRGGVNAVPSEQVEAATALNMRPVIRMWRIVLPQALIVILPPYGNLLVQLLKGTALVSLITISDLTFEALLLRTRLSSSTEPFLTILIIYFALAWGITRLVRMAERRTSIGFHIGAGTSNPTPVGAKDR